MEDNKNVQQINIELTQEVSEGEYANFVIVTHSPAEFVMDFTFILGNLRLIFDFIPGDKAITKSDFL